MMTIGWDRPMTPYDRPKEIPPIQVAVDADLLKNPKESQPSRRLQEIVRGKEEIWF